MVGLDSALAAIMQEHAARSSLLKERAEKAKKEALYAAHTVSGLLVEALNKDVQKSFQREKQIAVEAQALSLTVQRFVKQTDQWLTVINAFDAALKEIGDFENWIKVMEYDCENIANAVCHASLIVGRSPFV